MTATNRTHMIDEEFENARADLYGVQFTKVRKIGYAASLNGQTQWIDVDAGKKKSLYLFLLNRLLILFQKTIHPKK